MDPFNKGPAMKAGDTRHGSHRDGISKTGLSISKSEAGMIVKKVNAMHSRLATKYNAQLPRMVAEQGEALGPLVDEDETWLWPDESVADPYFAARARAALDMQPEAASLRAAIQIAIEAFGISPEAAEQAAPAIVHAAKTLG
jgi:hypothetical protein